MPRKTLKQRKEPNPTSDKSNRVRNVLDNLIGTEDPDDLMIEIFGEAGRHSRSAVGVNTLPMGICVEVEGIFEIRD